VWQRIPRRPKCHGRGRPSPYVHRRVLNAVHAASSVRYLNPLGVTHTPDGSRVHPARLSFRTATCASVAMVKFLSVSGMMPSPSFSVTTCTILSPNGQRWTLVTVSAVGAVSIRQRERESVPPGPSLQGSYKSSARFMRLSQASRARLESEVCDVCASRFLALFVCDVAESTD
jgi:hypothetical protein